MSKLTQNIDLRLGQNLVMTPQLQQAIKLLQMSNLELDAFLEGELEQNPLLEKIDAEGKETSLDQKADAETAADNAADQNELPDNQQPLEDFDAGSKMAEIGAGGNSAFEEMEESRDARLQETKTLRDHLTTQLAMSIEQERDRMIGALLIDQLDEAGYLRADVRELSERLSAPMERIHAVLRILRGFDPPGVFAHDLADCLGLQLEDQGKLDAPMKTLLRHLDLIASRDTRKLAQLCEVNDQYLADMIAEIKALNPKPASAFDHTVTQTAVPDVLMKTLPKNLGGGWRVELNNDTLPRVLINQTYFQDVLSRAKTDKDKSYLNTQMSSASWLVKALDQRAQTILKVASAIVEEQEGFFLYGIEYLKPLTLKDIAETIQMHESTVSRVTTNKFIGTPRGIFELKFFFTTAIAGTSGQMHSAESVKSKVKSLIDAETVQKILSDDDIVDLLKKDGIDIARRTVAKYREALRIPSSVDRRKIKRNS